MLGKEEKGKWEGLKDGRTPGGLGYRKEEGWTPGGLEYRKEDG